MSAGIEVKEFRHIPGVNDAEYIKLLEEHSERWKRIANNAISKLKRMSAERPEITHEQAIDYLRETGWLQNHDRILTESKVPLKGTWKDYTDEGYVECPFCKSATNCESKEDIDDLHFCFSCGAMLKRGEADGQ